ncbi:MAG: enoyl-CoA hydratase [Proteobacteria bacterium]|nr:enoyl-CoA hydratase [Pseudomonadota bacterium]
MSELITISQHPEEGSIGILHMKDAESKNTFTDEFVELFIEILKSLQNDSQYKVILLKGLPDIFCAGASKKALMSLFEGNLEVKDLILSELLLNIPVPVIAAMEGSALGGGFVVGLCCDVVLMNEKKMYGVNFTNLGFTPGMGCTRLIQPLVGDFVANEMMFRGRLFKGREFRGRSLINYILPKEEIMEKAVDIALDICEKPRKTLEILKYSISLRKRRLLLEARVHEDFMHKISFAQPEVEEIIERMYND